MTSSLGGFGGMGASQGPRGGGPGDVIPKGYRKGQINQWQPEQWDLFRQAFGQIGPDSYLSRLAGGDEDIFNEIEAPAHRQFQGQLGNIASRFSGQGQGGRRSSGFQNATTSAASNFAQDLQSNRQNLQRQAIMDLMGLSQQLLGQRPYQTDLFEKQQKQQQGGWGGAASGALSGATSGSAFGPWGTAIGAGVGGAAGYFS